MNKVEVPDETACPRCRKSSRDGNCTCYSSGEFNDVMRQLRAAEVKLQVLEAWRDEEVVKTIAQVADHPQVPCEGGCGGSADAAAVYHYCPACQEGAAILNRNAIRLQRERADENFASYERVKGLYSTAVVERDAAREDAAQVRGSLGNKLGVLTKENYDLKAAIRLHRDQKGDDRCWLDDQALYDVLGEPRVANTALPCREVFLGNCARYHASRQAPGHHYQTVEEQLVPYKALVRLIRGMVQGIEACKLISSNHVTDECLGCLITKLEKE